MPKKHPSAETLRRVTSGEIGGREAKEVLTHLLVECRGCAARARRIASAKAAVGGEADYGNAFARSAALTAEASATLAQERLRATALWAALESKSQAQRLYLVERAAAFGSWALVERLVEIAEEMRWRNPRRALEVGQLATVLSKRLKPMSRPAGLAADLRAAALGSFASALTLRDEPAAAQQVFAEAWRALEDGSGDRCEEARLLRQEATLHLSLGDFGTAASLLRPAGRLFRLVGDRHEEGRTLFQLALATGYVEPRAGSELAARALERIDPWREPRLELAIRHAMSWFLNEGGDARQALAALEGARELYRQFEGSGPRLFQGWLEGRISRGLGDLASAEAMFKAVWHDFWEAGFNRDVTLVSVDLAEVYLVLGERRRAARLLEMVRSMLVKWKMHAFGLAAWVELQEAAAREAAAAQALARQIALYYRQAWRRPGVPFVAGGVVMAGGGAAGEGGAAEGRGAVEGGTV